MADPSLHGNLSTLNHPLYLAVLAKLATPGLAGVNSPGNV